MFDPKDIKTIAQAMVDYHIVPYNGYEGEHCRYCYGEAWEDEPERTEHDLSCPVLVAKDVLTRIDEIE